MTSGSERLADRALYRRADAGLRHGLFVLVQLQIAMALGAFVCLLFGSLTRAASIATTYYRPGTVLYFVADVLFLTIPVVAWMLFRGGGWRQSVELGIAMLAPVAAIMILGELTRSPYLLWLLTAMYPAMSLGMLVYVLVRMNARRN